MCSIPRCYLQGCSFHSLYSANPNNSQWHYSSLVPRPLQYFISQPWKKIRRRPGINTTSWTGNGGLGQYIMWTWFVLTESTISGPWRSFDPRPSPNFSLWLRDKSGSGLGMRLRDLMVPSASSLPLSVMGHICFFISVELVHRTWICFSTCANLKSVRSFKFSVYGHPQIFTHVKQCSHASVWLAQACPNKVSVHMV